MKANILQHSTSSKFGRFVKKQWVWWLMLLPGVVLTVVFKYGSMFGIVMAFQKFDIFLFGKRLGSHIKKFGFSRQDIFFYQIDRCFIQ